MTTLTTKRRLWYLLSAVLIIPGLISLVFSGLNLGIDFTGGTQMQLQFQQPASSEDIQAAVEGAGYDGAVVQSVDVEGGNAYQIKTSEIGEGTDAKAQLYAAITDRVGPFTELSIATIGGSVSDQLSRNAILAILVASLFILLYIAIAFRNTRSPFLYGSCAIAAMACDVLFVIGLFSIFGWLFGIEVDTLFVTALLTVIGFSVHDKIVVFDRIRENLARRVGASFEDTVNYSIAQTLVRSVNTSLTVVFTLLALFLLGGGSTRNFVLALLIGIVSGTYSSIFTAAQLLVSWENGDIQRLFGRGRGKRELVVDPRVRPAAAPASR
jgi:preprotein translocase subunit SecF